MVPKISIIVPVYKVEPYLCKCIDSILAQTFTDFELILVDDGSPDRCGEICDEYAKKDNRIRVIHKKNGGLSSARNAGIDIAKGKYIGFVDSDDYIREDMLGALFGVAEKYSSDMVICDLLKVSENQEVDESPSNDEEVIKHFTNIQALRDLYEIKNGAFTTGIINSQWWIFAVNKLYRRQLFDSIRFEKGRIFEDEFIAHRLLYNCTNITVIKKKLYYYVQREDSIIHSPFTTKKLDKVYALKERVDYFCEKKLDELQTQATRQYLDVFLKYYELARDHLPETNPDISMLKKMFKKSLTLFMKNPLISWKQKIMIFMFVLNPSIYGAVVNIQKQFNTK
jgi:glycosyltransferase involved in cell wall biosynthesis